MIDHIGVPVSDIARATEFYRKALEPLGLGIVMQVSGPWRRGRLRSARQGRGLSERQAFLLDRRGERLGGHVHVAFVAPSRAAVDAFYRAGLAVGGKDNGPPGLRPHYHVNYYGAFVLDLDGNNIEAVCHAPA
jgi:catechol 2,3-dioxygenase-like lactoylglutathione lyase family enzyme